MGTMTYYVALAFRKTEDGGDVVACDPKEARSSEQATRMARSLAAKEGHCGAIAFARTGEPRFGRLRGCCDFEGSRRGRYRAIVCVVGSLGTPQRVGGSSAQIAVIHSGPKHTATAPVGAPMLLAIDLGRRLAQRGDGPLNRCGRNPEEAREWLVEL
jgi:hypothetical protein